MMAGLFSVLGLNLELLSTPGKHSTTDVYPSLVRILFSTIHMMDMKAAAEEGHMHRCKLPNKLQPERLQAQALPRRRWRMKTETGEFSNN